MRVNKDSRLRRRWTEADSVADVTALTIDSANRTYAATSLGIQVFDPTGRLCGVFTSPGSGITSLEFDGNKLFAVTGDKTYVRIMQASKQCPC